MASLAFATACRSRRRAPTWMWSEHDCSALSEGQRPIGDCPGLDPRPALAAVAHAGAGRLWRVVLPDADRLHQSGESPVRARWSGDRKSPCASPSARGVTGCCSNCSPRICCSRSPAAASDCSLAAAALPCWPAWFRPRCRSAPRLKSTWRVFGFAAALVVFTAFAFGVGPAWQSYRTADAQSAAVRAGVGDGGSRLRSTLVLAEVAGTVTLLVAAGLLVKALWRVQALDPGFAPKACSRCGPPCRHRGTRRRRAADVLLARADRRARPSRRDVGRLRPLSTDGTRERPRRSWRRAVADDPLSAPQAVIHFVTPGFFERLEFRSRPAAISPNRMERRRRVSS